MITVPPWHYDTRLINVINSVYCAFRPNDGNGVLYQKSYNVDAVETK